MKLKRSLAIDVDAMVAAAGEERPVSGGAYYQPTILTHVHDQMEAVRNEIFGPVMTVQTFDDENEALALADHPDYGLASGIHTADISRALRMARGIEAGTVWVNRYGRTSGFGKDLGRQAYEANLRIKSVLIDISRS